jgi:hypothetical protein
MNGALFLRFAILVGAEVFFLGSLNLFDDWTLQQMPVRFVGAAFASGIAYLAAVSHFPPKIDIPKQAIIFWGVAVVLRVVALPLVPSDDLIRHQWEGKVQRASFNPYLLAPSDSQLDDLRHDFPEAAKINHPELRAFDPPGTEFLFKALGGVTDQPLFYKIIFAIADLAVAAVLLRLIGGEERYRNAAWYAWNPLVVYSFAGAAHFDSVMILALVGGILALAKSTLATESARQWLWVLSAATLFGIAISFNVFIASLILICVFALRWRSIALIITACIPILLSFPFGLQNVWKSIGQVRQLPRLNDFSWWLVEAFWDNPHQRNFHYYPILIVCVVVVSLLFVRDWKRGTIWSLGTALILSPILHPWYCTWILPLATWRRAYAWHVLSITLFTYYLFWDERLFALPWHADPWMRELIIAPVFAALIMLAAARKRAEAAAV